MSRKFDFDFDSFLNPPDEYGIVSFYWWVGEPLCRERLLDQLDQLVGMDIAGVQINYCHTDEGGLSYGLPYLSDPPQFSEAWWELFGWFLEEANGRGISVSVSDYTLTRAGQGFFFDEILSRRPEMTGQRLRYRRYELNRGERLEIDGSQAVLSLVVLSPVDRFPANVRTVEPGWVCDMDGARVALVASEKVPHSVDPMHESAGAELIRVFFGRFESRFPSKCGKGLDYFFSDELDFGVDGKLWNDAFAERFESEKGYDVRPFLPALFEDVGDLTPKIRLDYCDMIVRLEEENYFRPVYLWHEARGMTYGCDHGGRGKIVNEFGDYFRTQKYNQGPGNDQYNLQSDVVKNKVSSSIAHLYRRPRTWLEGFYGSGWGTSASELADAVFRNFAMGHNLLSLHGLYYTTFGGYFEWAPPCNHFRMPYWRMAKNLNRCVKRLSYLNTRGVHRCDVAIVYPVADVEEGENGTSAAETAFSAAESLYSKGIDFDFIDFESVEEGRIEGSVFLAADARYSVMVLPDMKTVRFGMLERLYAFAEAGGRVFCLGRTPEQSDRAGRNDDVLDELVRRLFPPQNRLGSEAELLEKIDASIGRDFRILESDASFLPFVQHRVLSDADFYMVYGLPQGTECEFRANGKAVLIDPLRGRCTALCSKKTENGSALRIPLPARSPQIIAFLRRPPEFSIQDAERLETVSERRVEGEWACRCVPTMDNRWGDFEHPAGGLIGPQARRVRACGKEYTMGYGPYFKVGGPFQSEASVRIEEALLGGKWDDPEMHDYCFSMRFGIEGNPGHQGYHGLKGKISNEFLAFGSVKRGPCEDIYESEEESACYFAATFLRSETEQRVRFLHGTLKPVRVWLDGVSLPDANLVVLSPGFHRIILKYAGAGRTYFVAVKEGSARFAPIPLSMMWYRHPGVLPFFIEPTEKTTVRAEFDCPPGLETMELRTAGPLTLERNGRPQTCELEQVTDGVYAYRVSCKSRTASTAVAVVEAKNGHSGGAAFAEFVNFQLGEGAVSLGDWSAMPALCDYSGGICYRKTVRADRIRSEIRTFLDLGEVGCSAEVRVNGRLVECLHFAPYESEITQYLIEGENLFEIIVCNTLSNHYHTIPTRYNKPQISGLIGPVKWVERKKVSEERTT